MKLINDTSMAVSVACYDCDEPLQAARAAARATEGAG